MRPYCTFRTGGPARYFARARAASHVPFLVAQARGLRVPLLILGGGSNILCTDGTIERFVIKMEENAIRLIDETPKALSAEVAAGTSWDAVASWAVARGASGIEALSAIPGTAGAAPVQNIGAYGQEISDTITHVRAYDTSEDKFVDLPAGECGFGYRTSIFKTEGRGRFIIVSVRFILAKRPPIFPHYPDLERYFAEHPALARSAQTVRDAVIAIRARKLPDPAATPNAGSFFKNAIISRPRYDALHRRFPELPSSPFGRGWRKIPAGWLIDQCGFKGVWLGNAGVYGKNAAVVVGNHKVTYRDVVTLRDTITERVRGTFGITLEMEPDEVGSAPGKPGG